MNLVETMKLCRFVAAACPAQQFDEFTPDTWQALLADLRYEDCRAATLAVGKRQPFVSPADVRAEVKVIRARRLENFDRVPIDHDPDDARGWVERRRELMRAVADGDLEIPEVEIGTDPGMLQLLAKVVRKP